MRDAQTLRNPKSLHIFTGNVDTSVEMKVTKLFPEELSNLYCGQSMDLYWAHYLKCPTEAEYIEMVDNSTLTIPSSSDKALLTSLETGGLFRMLSKLMQTESTTCSYVFLIHVKVALPTRSRTLSLDTFVTLLGRYFQIRDDYQNLMSSDVCITTFSIIDFRHS